MGIVNCLVNLLFCGIPCVGGLVDRLVLGAGSLPNHGILDIKGLVFDVSTRIGSRLLDLFEELVAVALSGSIIDVAAVLVGVVGESHGARFAVLIFNGFVRKKWNHISGEDRMLQCCRLIADLER